MGHPVAFVLSLLIYLGSWLFAIIWLNACGGDGGTISDPEAQLPGLPVGASIQCAHDGDVYICNDNECFPDSTYEVTEAVADMETGETKYIAIPKLDIQGPVTVIAECGSNVVFSLREDNSTLDLDASGTVTQ